MSVRVNIDIPEEVLSITRSTPELFVKEMRLATAVKWYEIGRISQSKAAELAGLSRQEFIEVLSQFNVSPIQTTPDELIREFNEG